MIFLLKMAYLDLKHLHNMAKNFYYMCMNYHQYYNQTKIILTV